MIKFEVNPGDIVIVTNLFDNTSTKYLWALGGLLIFGEFLSLIMVCGILLFLRSHASLFSKSTYRLHVQFTILLGIQVEFRKQTF